MSARSRGQSALEAFRSMALTPTRIRRADLDLTNSLSGQRSEVFSFTAPFPLELRDDVPFRLMLPTHNGFFHNGATTAEQTYDLDPNPIDTGNTTAIIVFAGTTQLTRNDPTPADDEFALDVTSASAELTVDVDTDETIHAFYFTRAGLTLDVVKEKPGTTGSIEESVYDDITTDLHERDQHSEPPFMSFNQSAYESVVPMDWNIVAYVDGSGFQVEWDDSDTDTSGSKVVSDVDATNAIVDLPVRMAPADVQGLGREVAQDIGSRR